MNRYLAILIFICACNLPSNNEVNNSKFKNEIKIEYTISDFLNDKLVPSCIKAIYLKKINPNENESCGFALLDSTLSKDKVRPPFYFLTLTQSFEIADGAYSEAICNFSESYVMNNTKAFVSQLISNKYLKNNATELWANNVMMELVDFADNDANKQVADYIKKLITKMALLDNKQKLKLDTFIKLMQSYQP
jgi:hypothetical protein